MIIIGLCGLAGAGKDCVAEILSSRLGFASMAFADPVYEAAAAIVGVPVYQLKKREFKEAEIPWLGLSPRRLMQLLGTEFGRGMVSTDIWVKRLAARLEAAPASWRPTVISDVRFDNEAAFIARTPGGRVWRVVRPGAGCPAADAAGHSSEAGVSDAYVDTVIENDGSLDDLARKVIATYSGQFRAIKAEISG